MSHGFNYALACLPAHCDRQTVSALRWLSEARLTSDPVISKNLIRTWSGKNTNMKQFQFNKHVLLSICAINLTNWLIVFGQSNCSQCNYASRAMLFCLVHRTYLLPFKIKVAPRKHVNLPRGN